MVLFDAIRAFNTPSGVIVFEPAAESHASWSVIANRDRAVVGHDGVTVGLMRGAIATCDVTFGPREPRRGSLF